MANIHPGVRIVRDDVVEALDVFGAAMNILSDATNLPLMVGEHVVPPGYGVPMHVHDHDDELFLMLAGELTVIGESGEARVGPGTCVELPRGRPHSFRNDSDADARLYVMALPGQHALEMFRHFDRVGRSGKPLAPADIPAIAGQYGVRFI